MNKSKKISSWANYPKRFGKEHIFSSKKKLSKFIISQNNIIPFGNRRNYGDCALNKHMIKFDDKDKSIQLDKKTGIVKVKSNIQIKELIDYSLQYNWFLNVVPGSSYITIGGAIASDVHGKNHHIDGCFSESILSISIMTANGTILECSRNNNSNLFRSTCGGMGLTGIILSAELKMIKVQSHQIKQTSYKTNSLEELFNYFENNSFKKFSMAWIDCSSNHKSIGRGIFISGNYSRKNKKNRNKIINIKLPFFFPNYILNTSFIKIFNSLYYHFFSFKKKGTKIIDFYNFFFPLDKILNWNKLYGKSGFLQYQFVLPKRNSLEGIKKIIKIITESNQISPLAVLKLLGPKNKNYLSFPMEGYTLAVDFKFNKNLFSLLDKIDIVVQKLGGRIYLAKDARMQSQIFKSSYPDLSKFETYRKNSRLDDKFNSDQSKRLGIK